MVVMVAVVVVNLVISSLGIRYLRAVTRSASGTVSNSSRGWGETCFEVHGLGPGRRM
jgi:hypothetical protein